MLRYAVDERPHWRDRASQLGFAFHSPNGEPYWDETAYYGFTLQQVEKDIEAASAEVEALCRHLVDRVVRDERLLARLAIPEHAWGLVRTSWQRGAPALYGRLDLSYDGTGPAKLLEYNADTPTSLYEAGVFQWFWLEDRIADGTLRPDADQYNSIHEKLVARFGELADGNVLHLACAADAPEDQGTVDYIAECARQGGFETRNITMSDIGLGSDGAFYDLSDRPISRLFKLYPWEWLLAEPFARGFSTSTTQIIEPAWKAVLSNKGILPLLWDMEPHHPNLLPAYFEDDPGGSRLGGSYARKPLFSREGANIELREMGLLTDSDAGPYGGGAFIRQALAPLPCFDGNFAVVGSWLVGGQPAGLGIREDKSAITKNTSRFVPHAIVG